MTISTPHEIARCLIYDFGLNDAIRYARKMTTSAYGECRIAYEEALIILENKKNVVAASAEAGSFDLGMIP